MAGPAFPTVASSSLHTFPATMLVSDITRLSIPRSTSSQNTTPSNSRSSTGARLAALFAKPLVSDSDLPPVVPAPDGLLSPDLPSSESVPSTRKHQNSLDVDLLAIGKVVRHGEFTKRIVSGTSARLRQSLDEIEGCGGLDTSNQFCAFAGKFQPPAAWSSVDEIADEYQDALEAAGRDITRHFREQMVQSRLQQSEGAESNNNGLSKAEQDLLDGRVASSLEALEEKLTLVLFDKLFVPPFSDDDQQDENLVSRIKALNALELSLEHLGLDLGDDGGNDGYGGEATQIREGLDDIVAAVGKGEQAAYHACVCVF